MKKTEKIIGSVLHLNMRHWLDTKIPDLGDILGVIAGFENNLNIDILIPVP
jgi:hypothetical protein